MKPSGPEAQAIRISVIIPTYQRRDIVLNTVYSLMRQEYDAPYEVIVVVDGSTDGTAQALQPLSPAFPFTVLEQGNQGASVARNQGARVARGEILLFLDDDMEADPRLLAEHDASHRAGAEIVLGCLLLHPQSPPSMLIPGVKSWVDDRVKRLSTLQLPPNVDDILTGQISLSRRLFEQMGGFDTRFTRDGSFGNEDIDFGYRLIQQGRRIVYNPKACSWQYYAVSPRQYLRQWRQAGQADVVLARKHPDRTDTIFHRRHRRTSRYLWRPLCAIPFLGAKLGDALRWLILKIVESGRQGPTITRLFMEVRTLEYWRGVAEAGGIPTRWPVRILAYHAIADLADDPLLKPYGVPPKRFQRHLRALQRIGFHFITADQLLQYLYNGASLPRRAVLLTFDDCYQDLVDVALPILKAYNIPALAFVVTGQIGGTNTWDTAIGGSTLPLLGINDLRKLSQEGIELGAHTRTHRPLDKLSAAELEEELAGSAADLEAHGFERPRFLAYPYGECNSEIRAAAQKAGYCAAFTIDGGLVLPEHDRFQLARIEIHREDTCLRFLGQVLFPNCSLFTDRWFWPRLRRLAALSRRRLGQAVHSIRWLSTR
jgi:peptidoglycan/xylan/chitin deacetylase (PgdA/CDA1 family)/GT2 family glycosyltransferase